MTIVCELLPDKLVTLDDRTAQLGGGFWYEPLRVYDPNPLKFAYEQLSRVENPVLIDVGASTGVFSLLAKFIPNLVVYAFEPVPLTYEVLDENIRLNGLEERAFTYPYAVSEKIGMDILHVVDPPEQSALSIVGGIPTNYKTFHDLPINIIDIDTFCREKGITPTLIKIDTEGHELAVLHGAHETLLAHAPTLIVEYEPINTAQYGYNPDEMEKWIAQFGYSLSRPFGPDLFCVYGDKQ